MEDKDLSPVAVVTGSVINICNNFEITGKKSGLKRKSSVIVYDEFGDLDVQLLYQFKFTITYF